MPLFSTVIIFVLCLFVLLFFLLKNKKDAVMEAGQSYLPKQTKILVTASQDLFIVFLFSILFSHFVLSSLVYATGTLTLICSIYTLIRGLKEKHRGVVRKMLYLLICMLVAWFVVVLPIQCDHTTDIVKSLLCIAYLGMWIFFLYAVIKKGYVLYKDIKNKDVSRIKTSALLFCIVLVLFVLLVVVSYENMFSSFHNVFDFLMKIS